MEEHDTHRVADRGPLALADLIGPDTVKAVAESLYAVSREPLYAPPPLLARWSRRASSAASPAAGFHTY
jgi:3-hydroxybutyryl-CoA dehydrogenase